jgi:hypothetical protein
MVLKTREKIMIGAALLIGLIMCFDQFVTRPKKKEAVALQKQVLELNEKLASVTGSLVGLNQIKRKVEEKRKEKEALSGRVSGDRQVEIILDQLGKESQTNRINLIQLSIAEKKSVRPGGEKEPPPGTFKKVNLEVELASDFAGIGPCLEDLSSLPIFAEMERIDIRRNEESFPKLQVTLQQILHISSAPDLQGIKP